MFQEHSTNKRLMSENLMDQLKKLVMEKNITGCPVTSIILAALWRSWLVGIPAHKQNQKMLTSSVLKK